ncbi:unnamed protein product [Brachionus calyciflorus]|uniref:Endonuclease/exonuclease/phosphatase domain-containing protein n=1 Tax=Brachionus calyciflorus TaxID=104777 RepID=A0A813URN0_9BILA|nr:unnamed protein product [Brachionus calyciflorus]
MVHRERKAGLNGAGGVGIMVKRNVNFVQIHDFDNLNLELVCIKIKIEQEDVYIVSYYNPPDQPLCHELFEKLNNIKFILCGGLNSKSFAYGCKTSNQNGKILDKIANLKNIIRLSDGSTTYKSFSNNKEDILDYIFSESSMIKNFYSFEKMQQCLMNSNHYPLRIKFGDQIERNEQLLNDKPKF